MKQTLTAEQIYEELGCQSKRDIIEAMKLYANVKLDEAADQAQVENITAYSQSRDIVKTYWKCNTKSIPGIVITIQVDKQSILKLKDPI
jgi:hypothetical protein